MANAVTINQKTIAEILTRLDRLARDVQAIKTRIFEQEPPYGSDAWWEKEHEEALEELKQGKYTVYDNAQELIKDLHRGR